MMVIDLTENLVHSVRSSDPKDVGRKIEVRDYDWPVSGDVENLPNDHKLVDNDSECYVSSVVTVGELT
jgi:hypothetical protein